MKWSKQSGVYVKNFLSWEARIWKENGVGKVSEVGTTHQGTPRGAWRALVYRAHLDHLPVYFFIPKILKYSKTDREYFCGFSESVYLPYHVPPILKYSGVFQKVSFMCSSGVKVWMTFLSTLIGVHEM